MIAKHSTKASECTALAEIMASPEFQIQPERVRKEAAGRKRGLEGERSTAHILDRQFHNSKDHALLHDLRIPDGIGSFAQFDHVILSRLSRTAAVVEVKNYSGRLSKNEHNEWHVWYDGRRRPIDVPNPLAQAKRQREVLRAWLKAHRHDVAFETIGAFVIVPSDCAIDRSKIGSDVAIYKADTFLAEWTQFGGISPLGKIFSAGVSHSLLKVIAAQLAADHVPVARGIGDMIGIKSAIRDPDEDSDSQAIESNDDSAEMALAENDQELSVQSVKAEPGSAAEIDQTIEAETVTTATIPARAAERVELMSGIFERLLPDGRIAFLSDNNDDDRNRLASACTGLARWNPRFRNWLTSAESADQIRANLLQAEAQLTHMLPSDQTLITNSQQLGAAT